MASLHPAFGSTTSARFNPQAFASPNPFLVAEAPAIALRAANTSAAQAESVEVTVLWGSNVLAVRQLTPPRKYAVGEVGGAGGAGTTQEGDVDFALSAERLGCARREIVTMRNATPTAVFFDGETPRVFEKGEVVDFNALIVDCAEIAPGARGIELRQDRVVIIDASGVSFRLGGCEKPETVPRAVLGSTDRSALFTMSTAAILQGLLVATLAYMTPSLAWGSEDELDKDNLELMQQYLHSSAEREHPDQPLPNEASSGEKGGPAAAAAGPAGVSGRANALPVPRHMAIKGDTAERVLSRAELKAEATQGGLIGMLNTMNASNAPSSPWGDIATGPDAVDAHGDLFSQEIGDTFGHGVALSGTDQGGGGKGTTPGTSITGVGTCMGVSCLGQGGNFAGSAGRMGGTYKPHDPRVALEPTHVSGHLPPEVIQRVVRQNFGRFRSCYENGLRTNPNLEGRVTARFVINGDGSVGNVSSGGDLPDAGVKSCVASAFYGLSFPAPDGGIVTVSYPIMLSPG